jgi:ABC-type branched-subunit amino acid transport system permease subunit
MKWHQFSLTLVVLVVLREVSGHLIERFTGIAPLANFGSLALAAFVAGWLGSSISMRPPSDRQLWALAALSVIACTLIGYLQGVPYTVLGALFILILHTPIAYVCLILGAKLAEGDFDASQSKPDLTRDGPTPD